MVRPFRDGMLSQACPMAEIFASLTSSLQELQVMKQSVDFDMAPS
jgi:adenylate cyclase